jgi:hypothetical protein
VYFEVICKTLALKEITVRRSDFGFLVSFLGNTETAQAQQIIRARFAWDFTPAGGAVYFNICDNPTISCSID